MNVNLITIAFLERNVATTVVLEDVSVQRLQMLAPVSVGKWAVIILRYLLYPIWNPSIILE